TKPVDVNALFFFSKFNRPSSIDFSSLFCKFSQRIRFLAKVAFGLKTPVLPLKMKGKLRKNGCFQAKNAVFKRKHIKMKEKY
ncbi:MAG: hypothetical protein II254_02250, partial [Oscillospiraceae bacterium]|nr:hypothetical protein [Oscillospiraceae bacterium]